MACIIQTGTGMPHNPVQCAVSTPGGRIQPQAVIHAPQGTSVLLAPLEPCSLGVHAATLGGVRVFQFEKHRKDEKLFPFSLVLNFHATFLTLMNSCYVLSA